MDWYCLELKGGGRDGAPPQVPILATRSRLPRKPEAALLLPQRWCDYWRRIIWTISSQPWRGCESRVSFNRAASQWGGTRLAALKRCWEENEEDIARGSIPQG